MKKHIVHYLLILLLAAAPMQSVLAGLAALEHATACKMGAMSAAEHAGMNHGDHGSAPDADKAPAQCDCCNDCLSLCVSFSKVPHLSSMELFSASAGNMTGHSDYQRSASSQYPPTDLRPPIVLH